MKTLQKLLKLSWVYEDDESLSSAIFLTEESSEQTEIIFPQDSELTAIQEALEIGDFETIELEAKRLQKLDERYLPFSNQIWTMAQEFDEEGIFKLLNHSE